MAKKSKEQWFAECGNMISNESLAMSLAEIGISEAEAKHPGMQGSDGKKHDVWQIPSDFVKKLRSANQSDSRFKYRFWKRNGSEGVIYPADFVEKPKPSKELQKAKAKLKKIRAKAAKK
jgi:hypothetical protein